VKKRIGAAALALVLCRPWAPAIAKQWPAPTADMRVGLTVEGDLYRRAGTRLEKVIDFNELLGADRVLAAGSLEMRDGRNGETVKADMAQDAEIRYASGNPILRLRWRCDGLEPLERRQWRLYFHTVEPGAPDAWKPLDETFLPGRGATLFSTSFEDPDPASPRCPAGFRPAGRDKPGEKSERVWVADEARAGKRSLRIARTYEGKPPRNTNRPFWWTWPPAIRVGPGATYRLSAWVKTKRLKVGGIAMVNMLFRDANKRRIPKHSLRLRGGRIPHDWKRLTGTLAAPEGARWAEIMFSLSGEGEVYCDDLELSVLAGSALPALPVSVGRLEERSEFETARAARETAKKVLKCAFAKRPPKLDGALDDPCWRTAGRIEDLDVFFKAPVPRVSTTVLACADEQALYFGFRCAETTTKGLVTTATERDGPVWRDDSVELFLDTNHDRRTYYQIVVNSKGVFFDQDTGAAGKARAKWNGPIAAAARVRPDGWTAEVRLEFTGLRLAEASGRAWGANFTRTSLREGRSLYSWIKVKKNFGEADLFGDLILPIDPSANAVTGRVMAGERLHWGEGEVPFEVRNNRGRPVRVRLVVSEEGTTGGALVGKTEAAVRPRAAAALGVACAFRREDDVTLKYELFELPEGKLLYTTSLTHTVPPPLDIAMDNRLLYLDERRLSGHWTLGLSESARAGATLKLTTRRVGDPRTVAEQVIAPTRPSGDFHLELGNAPAGAYRLRCALLRANRPFRVLTFSFQRVRGPFD